MISIAGVQLASEEASTVQIRRDNVNRAVDLIQSNPGHNLYILPECATIGYGDIAFKALDETAEDIETGESFKVFAALAKKIDAYISYSFARKDSTTGKLHISNCVVSNEGECVSLYDKLHICQFGECHEKDYFSPGDSMPTPFEIDGVVCGVGICYDIRFPEFTRYQAIKQGIDVLIHPGGWPRDCTFESWHKFVITRALENQIYLFSINKASTNNGGSIICQPFVDFDQIKPMVAGTNECVVAMAVTVGEIERVRKTINYVADARFDIYGDTQ